MRNSCFNQVYRIAALLACGVALLAGCGQKTDSVGPSPNVESATRKTADGASGSGETSALAQTLAEKLSQDNSSRQQKATEGVSESPHSATSSPQPMPPRRMANDQPALNSARLKAVGIRRYESQRLVLLTDLPAERIAGLPELADQLFHQLEAHFGKLPPALDGSDFQVTGCVIEDVKRFQSAGLMPAESFTFSHGRHMDYQFWCYSQDSEYYLRHLVLHEFTHCFMTCESGLLNIPPLWYIEGMAEYFATHRVDETTKATFGVLPDSFEGYEGWGRISALEREFERGLRSANNTARPAGPLPIPPLNQALRDVTFKSTDLDYAQWWAISWMLQSNPQCSSAFEPLRQLRTREEFISKVHEIRETVDGKLQADWLLFAESLDTGFDSARGFPVHAESVVSLTEDASTPATFRVAANAEWQDSGIRLRSGQSVTVACHGQYSVNQPADAWVCEPMGVGVEYYRGIPLGAVVATFVDSNGFSLTRRSFVGREATLTAENDASLWLQINDSCSSRSNNSGEVAVSVSLLTK